MEAKFRIKSYGYGELAQLYFPNISKKSASAQLRRWIKLSETVLPMLKSHGYKPGLRLLTPAHVKVIVEEFGEPWDCLTVSGFALVDFWKPKTVCQHLRLLIAQMFLFALSAH